MSVRFVHGLFMVTVKQNTNKERKGRKTMKKAAVKRVSGLTFEEFKKFVENNGYVDSIKESAWYCVNNNADEILSYFEYEKAVYTMKGRESRRTYCIDFEIDGCGYRYSYMNVNKGCGGYVCSDDLEAVVNALQRLYSEMYVISDEAAKKIDRISERVDFYIDAAAGYENISDDKLDSLEKWISDGVQAALDEVLQYILSDYEYYSEEENVIEMAYESGWFESDLYCDVENDYAEIILTEPETLYHVNGKVFKTYSEMAAEYNRTHENAIPLF